MKRRHSKLLVTCRLLWISLQMCLLSPIHQHFLTRDCSTCSAASERLFMRHCGSEPWCLNMGVDTILSHYCRSSMQIYSLKYAWLTAYRNMTSAAATFWLIDWLIELYFSTVKILAQRPTHVSAVATVLLITKTFRVKYYYRMRGEGQIQHW